MSLKKEQEQRKISKQAHETNSIPSNTSAFAHISPELNHPMDALSTVAN